MTRTDGIREGNIFYVSSRSKAAFESSRSKLRQDKGSIGTSVQATFGDREDGAWRAILGNGTVILTTMLTSRSHIHQSLSAWVLAVSFRSKPRRLLRVLPRFQVNSDVSKGTRELSRECGGRPRDAQEVESKILIPSPLIRSSLVSCSTPPITSSTNHLQASDTGSIDLIRLLGYQINW